MSDLLIACRHNNGFIKLKLIELRATSGCAFMLPGTCSSFLYRPITYHS